MMSTKTPSPIQHPLELLRISLEERILVSLRGDRQLTGLLHAYDNHLNLVLSHVEETLVTTVVNPDTLEQTIMKPKRDIEMLFVRGDGVIMISPITKA